MVVSTVGECQFIGGKTHRSSCVQSLVRAARECARAANNCGCLLKHMAFKLVMLVVVATGQVFTLARSSADVAVALGVALQITAAGADPYLLFHPCSPASLTVGILILTFLALPEPFDAARFCTLWKKSTNPLFEKCHNVNYSTRSMQRSL